MMNIAQLQARLQGLSDRQLAEQMQGGTVPEYLVLTELNRRKKLRQEAQTPNEPPQGTVADEMVSGIATLPMEAPQFAEGGIVSFADGGRVTLEDVIAAYSGLADKKSKDYNPEYAKLLREASYGLHKEWAGMSGKEGQQFAKDFMGRTLSPRDEGYSGAFQALTYSPEAREKVLNRFDYYAPHAGKIMDATGWRKPRGAEEQAIVDKRSGWLDAARDWGGIYGETLPMETLRRLDLVSSVATPAAGAPPEGSFPVAFAPTVPPAPTVPTAPTANDAATAEIVANYFRHDPVDAESWRLAAATQQEPPTQLVASSTPATTASAPAAKTGPQLSHEVKKGETFSSIARQEKVGLQALLAANPKYAEDPRSLPENAVLSIPAKGTVAADAPKTTPTKLVASKMPATAATTASATPANAGAQLSYPVEKGDTLYSIAKEKGVGLQALRDANNLTKDDDSKLKIGTVLSIPTGGAVASAGEPARGPLHAQTATPKTQDRITDTGVRALLGDVKYPAAAPVGQKTSGFSIGDLAQAAFGIGDAHAADIPGGHKPATSKTATRADSLAPQTPNSIAATLKPGDVFAFGGTNFKVSKGGQAFATKDAATVKTPIPTVENTPSRNLAEVYKGKPPAPVLSAAETAVKAEQQAEQNKLLGQAENTPRALKATDQLIADQYAQMHAAKDLIPGLDPVVVPPAAAVPGKKPAVLDKKPADKPKDIPAPTVAQPSGIEAVLAKLQQGMQPYPTYNDAEQRKVLADLREKYDADTKGDKWMALAEAGFAMAAGQSPYALANLGAGAQKGINRLLEDKKARRDFAKEIAQAEISLAEAKRKGDVDRVNYEMNKLKYLTDAAIGLETLSAQKAHWKATEEHQKASALAEAAKLRQARASAIKEEVVVLRGEWKDEMDKTKKAFIEQQINALEAERRKLLGMDATPAPSPALGNTPGGAGVVGVKRLDK